MRLTKSERTGWILIILGFLSPVIIAFMSWLAGLFNGSLDPKDFSFVFKGAHFALPIILLIPGVLMVTPIVDWILRALGRNGAKKK